MRPATILILFLICAIGPSFAEAPPYAAVGRIETPSSESTAAWNDKYLAIAIFEQISPDVEINIIERVSGAISKIVLPKSYIVYSMFFDKDDPQILWVTTS